MLENKIYVGQLLDAYGELLTQKQRSILESFYLLDNSYSEIAELENTSRQAIFDCIQKATVTLRNYEEKLGLLAKTVELKAGLSRIKEASDDDEIKHIAEMLIFKL